jgi:2-keto-3-deoxy-6-phosphogluconate aldolase
MKTYSIVGMNFTKSEDFVKNLQAGMPVVLIREPTNAYDPNAVAVWIEGRRVGYIPKAQNKVLAAFIDQAGDGAVGAGALMAMDQNPETCRAVTAKFIRSPNSHYPMVEL